MIENELKKIDDVLIDDEGDYDEDFPPPSKESIAVAKKFVEHAVSTLKEDYPPGQVVPDGRGGLTICYRRGKKILQFIVRIPYIGIFWKEGKEYGQHQIYDRNLLVTKLVWLLTV